MPETRFTHRLTGCAPIPLAHYLKALGILRLVAEQADPTAQGWWSGDVFHLRTSLDEAALQRFFLEEYKPTPVVVPWSGNDFFAASRNPDPTSFLQRWPITSQKYCPTASAIIEAFLVSDSSRLRHYRNDIHGVFTAMLQSGALDKSSIEGQSGQKVKRAFLTALRSILSDAAVRWIDSAAVLSTDAFVFNAILGSGGGSDGNSHFSDNFMQSLWLVLPDFDAHRRTSVRAVGGLFSSTAAIGHSLYGRESTQAIISGRSPGLFSSQDVGGPNALSGFTAEAAFNPWDYVLCIEGCLAFSGALARKVGSASGPAAAFPFVMRLTTSGAGTLVPQEASAREAWLPLWNKPAIGSELAAFFSEGRLSLGSEYCQRGVEAARAVATYGYDRGVSAYERVGIVRGRVGGDNYNTSVALGRWMPQFNSGATLLPILDKWTNDVRREASSDTAPASVARSLRKLDDAVLSLCRCTRSDGLTEVLIALGELEAIIAKSLTWAKDAKLRPVPLLPPQWLTDCYDHSIEFRLAASLAAMDSRLFDGLRPYCEPVEKGSRKDGSERWYAWSEEASSQSRVVWHNGTLADNLIAMLNRRIVEAVQEGAEANGGSTVFPGNSHLFAELSDIHRFLAGETDDERLALLFRGLLLIDWEAVTSEHFAEGRPDEGWNACPSAAYAVLKLCHNPFPIRESRVRLDPAIARLACAGRLNDATRLASRRLLGSGLPPLSKSVQGGSASARRIAAAILFPIDDTTVRQLAEGVLKAPKPVAQ